jgi:DNA-binding NarL/FixJ family response regulator
LRNGRRDGTLKGIEVDSMDVRGRKSVWMVEDNDAFRMNFAEMIGHSSVMTCDNAFSNCEDMLSSLREGATTDVVLMDINLPGMSGLDGIVEAKAVSPGIKVVILTVFDDNDKIFRAICAGADGYLLKSTPPPKLLASLEEIVEGGAPMNSQIARKVLDLFGSRILPSSGYPLTDREREILKLLVDGHSKKQIAEEIFLSFHTIDTHLRNIYTKLHVHSRSAAVAKALKERIL